jgi:hypothetical protein
MSRKPSADDKKLALLTQMTVLVDEIELKSKDFYQMKDRIVKESGGRAEFLTGPQLASYSLVGDLKSIADQINAKGAEISRLVNTYNQN